MNSFTPQPATRNPQPAIFIKKLSETTIFTENPEAMKSNPFKTMAIVFFVSGIFLTSKSVYSQPAPDENFCEVNAKLINGDSICRVGAQFPLAYELDDGSAEDYLFWVFPGGMSVVKFEPPGYPVRLTAGKIYVGDGSFPAGNDFLGTDFQVIVYDDDGPDGFPGTLLDSIIVTVENYEWVTFNGFDVVIEEGAFYLGMKQLYGFGEEQHAAPVGIDTEVPIAYKSYIKNPGDDWILSTYQDLMIRAFTCGADVELRELNARAFDGFEIARVSDFNPDNGKGPEDGVLTVIDSITTFHAYDSLFYSLPEGYYAYAVRKIQQDTAATGWYYTNVLSHLISTIGDDATARSVVRVYPNPVKDMVYIESNESIQLVQLVNTLGQTVYSKRPDAKEISIQTGSFKSGFYFISIKTKQRKVNKKILIGER